MRNVYVIFLAGLVLSFMSANLSYGQKAPPISDLPEDEPIETPKPKSTKKAAPKSSSKKKVEVEDEVDSSSNNPLQVSDDLESALNNDEDVAASSPSEFKDNKKGIQTEEEDELEKALSVEEEAKPVQVSEEKDTAPQTSAGLTVVEEPLPESEKDPTLSPGVSEKDFQSSNAGDVLEVQKKFDEQVMPSALVDPAEDPGAALPPDEKFYRVPLRPRMSDASWRKWAGPALTKLYKIRKNDSLWSVSERLFGTPYLWPKVWHLNAAFTNPNVIEPGIEMQFNPGNPNSAPNLALIRNGEALNEPMPLLIQNRPLSMYERLENVLLMQVEGRNPPFTHFLVYRRPRAQGKVPNPEVYEKLMWGEGDRFPTRAPEGDYAIVRLQLADEESIFGQRIQWVGNVKVEGREGYITRAFAEVQEGDLLVDRNFQVAPSSVHEDSLEALSRKTKMVQLQDGVKSLVGANNLVGIILPSSQTGPGPGSLLGIEKNRKRIGTLLVIDRDQRMATAWVVDSSEEFDYDSVIQ